VPVGLNPSNTTMTDAPSTTSSAWAVTWVKAWVTLAPSATVPLGSLQSLTPTSWVKANSGSVTPLVYAVAPADSPFETMRDAIDGDADLASVDGHGWAVVTPASIEMF